LAKNLHTDKTGADLPQGEPTGRVYTKKEVLKIINTDRKKLIEFIRKELKYGVEDLFEQVSIEIPQ
jgi:hypothetical protein